MNWTIFRTKRFCDALDSYTAKVSGARRSVGDDRSAQTYLNTNREFRLFYEAVLRFESMKTDPVDLLPRAWDKGKVIPNVHFVRSGPYYALYQRDPKTTTATGTLVFKKNDRLRWIKEVLAKNVKFYW